MFSLANHGSKTDGSILLGRIRSKTIRGLALLLLCLAAWGCPTSPSVTPPGGTPGDATRANESPAPTEPSDSPGPTLRASIHPDLPQYSFTLRGVADESASIYRVERIDIRRGDEMEPVQVIEGLETETPVFDDLPAIEVLDMNFDGYADFSIIEFTTAGPNVPSLHWLFDPATSQFVSSPELDKITSAVFDRETGSVRSEWRDGAASYGTDVYSMVEGKPVLKRKERKTYSEEGYRWTVEELIDGAWQTSEDRMVREGEDDPPGG